MGGSDGAAFPGVWGRLTKEQEVTILEIALDQIAKEDVIRGILSTLSKKEIKALMEYLFDPEKAEDITHQEKTRFEKLLEDMRAGIEVCVCVCVCASHHHSHSVESLTMLLLRSLFHSLPRLF